MPDDIAIKPRTDSTPTAQNANLSPSVILCAAGLAGSFFMPWITLFFGHPSGYDLQQLGDIHLLNWAIPVFAVVAIVASLAKIGRRATAHIAGAIPYALLVFWLSKAGVDDYQGLLKSLNYGAYVALGCGLTLNVLAPFQK